MASAMKENLEKHFECSICLEKFNNPRVLSCLHTFCGRCLERLVKNGGEKWLVKCPECRKETEVPDGNVHNLQANFIINNIMSAVDLHRDSQTAKSAIGCDNCSAGDPAAVRCIICCHFLCDFCRQGHRRSNTTMDHKLETLEELKSRGPAALSKPSICRIHDGEPLKMYCESCRETICRDCTMVDHRDHKYQFVKDVYNKEKAAVNQLLGETKSKQSVLQDAIKGVVEMKTRVQRAGERVAQQINTSVDTLIQSLEARRNNLLQQGGVIEQGKLKGLQVQQDELELALSTVTSSVEFTEKALRDGSQVEVLSMKKQMMDRLRELNTGTRPLSPCTDDVICYDVNTESVDDVLNRLGRVSETRTSPDKCVIKTDIGIEDLKTRKETKILIFAKDQHEKQRESGGDDVSVEIKSPSARDGTQRVQVTDNNNGTYRASYTPRIYGIHRVFVKINGAHIQGSPFDWNVKIDSSAEMSTLQMEVEGNGVIYNTLVNQTRDFTIVTRDNNGEQIREVGDEISVQIKEPNTRTLEVIPVQDRGNGRYTFSYKPSSTGNYQVTVKVNGDDIQGSPFTWGVEQWHLVGGVRESEDLRFSQDNMTVCCTGFWGDWRVVGSCGFPAGFHSWKVKVVSGEMDAVGVTDCDVSPRRQENRWYWCGGSKHDVRDCKHTGTKQLSNITGFTAGDVCIVFLNHHNKQLTVHHLPSGQTDTWGDVTGENKKLSPYFYLPALSKITLLL